MNGLGTVDEWLELSILKNTPFTQLSLFCVVPNRLPGDVPRVCRKKIAAHMHAGERPATPAIPLPAALSANTFPLFLV
jgi:hypothetical protein